MSIRQFRIFSFCVCPLPNLSLLLSTKVAVGEYEGTCLHFQFIKQCLFPIHLLLDVYKTD